MMLVVPHVHARGLGCLACSRIGTRIETDDNRLGGERQIDVGLGDRAYSTVHHVDFDLVGRKPG